MHPSPKSSVAPSSVSTQLAVGDGLGSGLGDGHAWSGLVAGLGCDGGKASRRKQHMVSASEPSMAGIS